MRKCVREREGVREGERERERERDRERERVCEREIGEIEEELELRSERLQDFT